MANAIRYSTTGDTQSLKKGNFFFGVGDVGKGPSSATTYYNGSTPVASGYTIYSFDASQTSRISYASPTTDSEFISITNAKSGQNFTGVTQCLNWYATQTDYVAVNKDYESIITSGLTLCLDAGFTPSYQGSGTTWYDISDQVNNGTLVSGSQYNGGLLPYFQYSGNNQNTETTVTTVELTTGLTQGNTVEQFIWGDGSQGNGNMPFSFYNVAWNIWWLGNTFAFNNGSSLLYGFTGANDLLLNKWCHVVAYFPNNWPSSSGSTKMYINGVEKPLSFLAGTFQSRTISQSQTVGIGGGYTDGSDIFNWNGRIALTRIYNRQLSSSDVLNNYQSTFPRFLGKNIVMNGLVNYLDAGYNVSYPGTGTTWNNISGVSGGTGTLTNGPTYSSVNGGYFDFDGTNDFVDIPYNSYWDNNVFGNATNFTISCWAKCDSFFDWSCLIQKAPTASGFYASSEGASLWVNSSGFQAVFGNGAVGSNPSGYGTLVSFTTTNTNGWFHLLFTGDGTTGRLYVNGSLFSQSSLSRTATVTTSLNGPKLGVRSGPTYYNGKIANTLLYTRPLSATEVLQNYQAQLPTIVGENFITNGLVLYLDAGYRTSYPTTGTTWTNVSGVSGGTGTLTNGPTYTGTSGGTIVFDGTDDYVTTTNFYLSTSPATITTWFRAGTQTSSAGSILRPIAQQGVFNTSFPAQAQGIEINMIRTGNVDVGKLRFSWGGDVDTNYQYMTTNRYDDNQWHCASIVNNGNTFDVYIDGVYLSTKKTYTSVSTSTPMNFGGDTFVADRKWVGSISIIQIYDRAITQLELLQNFNAQKSRFGL